MASDQPPRTIVLVHGAFHGAACWWKLRQALEQLGIPTAAPDLPGHGHSTAAFTDLHGDAGSVRDLLAEVPGEVVLVGHSYGGAVITEASAGAANVAHLVYLAAFCPDEGETVMGLATSVDERGDLARAMRIGDDGQITLDATLLDEALYADCDPDDVAVVARSLGPQPAVTFRQPLAAAGWKERPSTYVVCTDDRAVPPPLQRTMAARCGRTIELASSHSPFLSHVDDVVAVLAPLAGGAA